MVLTVFELESLFIEKFCERFKLTERDVKRAFAQFDTDKNGLIDLNELTKGLRTYLNGVDDKLIAELVQHYDVNGDGCISFEEFYQFLVNRSAVSKKPPSSSSSSRCTERPPPVPRRGPRESLYTSPPSTSASRSSSHSTYSIPPPPPQQVQRYDNYDMSDVRSEISTILDPHDLAALEQRATIFLNNLKHFLNQSAMEARQRENIRNRLQVHSRELVDNVGKALLARELQRYAREINRVSRIDFLSFCKVLRSFSIPGVPSIPSEVLQHIYSTSAGNDDLLDVLRFVALLYDTKQQKGPDRVDRVGHGDYRKDALEPTSDTKGLEVKQKYICSKSRTTYLTPAGFDSSVLAKSSLPPQCSVRRGFVMGLRTQIYSGDSITCINGNAAEDRVIVYPASSLGIVHNLTTNTQLHFDAHDDEITCFTVDPSYTLAASGQLGKDPALYIWELSTATMVRRIGEGFFSRAVCAASFSHDSALICAVGCDNKHAMGVWSLRTGDLLVETTTSSGIPPQIRSMSYCQSPVATPYITRHHSGKNDLFVTGGEKDIRFWSLQRPKGSSPATITFKMGTFGLTSKKKSVKLIPAPRLYHTTAFLPLENGEDFDVLAGGDNGVLYLFKETACAATVKVTRGPLSVIKVVAQSIFCGTSEGTVCLYDGTLTLVSRFDASVVENQPLQQMYGETIANRRMVTQVAKKNATTAQRSKSAGRTRPAPSVRTASSRDDSSARVGGSRDSGSKVSQSATESGNAVVGISVDLAPFYYQDKGTSGARGATLVVVTSNGKCLRIHVDAPRATAPTELFTFHTGALWALTAAKSTSIFATGGDDCWLSVWDSHIMKLVTRYKTQFAIRCCCFNRQSNFIAVGMVNGYFAIHYLVKNAEHSSSHGSSISGPLAHRKDCKEDISDIKFNPSCDMLAVGSHDNYIDVYSCVLSAPQRPQEGPQCRVSPLHRLRGHSSYITHLDWSRDGQLIQSTCGAYELLHWDVQAGRLFSYATGWCAADVKWYTNTCILGFNVMGIWPQYADGTDINSIDVSKDKSWVATADDSGKLNIMNYPCVAKHAPRLTLGGHSSHVMNVTFMENDSKIATVGGNDNCAIVWFITSNTTKKYQR